ncbi:MAG: glyoxalase [Candidatus Taylorbacteria bacterium RIFCSPLOWO2_12_FULL_43_20]|uniref:Glyoxalase n=1 Tax=Candidatus Taylorbacteria bacterium RIFCSPLOWO2_12_FULL_43_20 TaxID=1802332 RepID=A0A1G2P4J9_9BACT|nr:MAG: glyoxalase [Candidatus Taylorbacteria bacterium RIFCSPHIGHO2_01_FULL_43_120]OHA22206.1 MAG: glyoxalase [Candidatus Taylorbacteria bacterium RIFCSPHIGHO2_02_FULL_43_55]OHA28309.1 MAG: glyoxalase [Candidatus Taylorbacteria bacterium RIFCSPHIGHO2_12_FULL_42_34]OHA30329.1 MAG: glyoxalase [Candidatus Taylorbacteria bacterium RIFCSPLOWO2_01_FULL_43_83]OHA37900.1 MAG: glyoxalase [Candidatus Taylorbacteria bacterium RIFCSPLOWO2_02_FULL_43_22b]OHA42552.1 MAG: glyoxalase [Candidatus Taylorbacter
MLKLNPYLRFNDDKCREAMNFYNDCLGGELTFQTMGESPMAGEMPEAKDKIIHASLKKGDMEILASDMMRDKAIVGDNVALSINCESEEEIKSLFSKFSDGGEVFMPLEKQFWGALFGVITDKYGVEWMFNYPLK